MDRGCQCTAQAFAKICDRTRPEPSMGAGNCHHSVMAESLFTKLECELMLGNDRH